MRSHLEAPLRTAAAALALLLLWGGSSGCDADDSPGPPADDDDTSGGEVLELTAAARLSDLVPTVILVSWELDDPDVEDAFVDYGYDDELGLRAPADHDGQGGFEAALLGLRPDAEVRLQASVVQAGEALVGEVLTITTGSLPAGLQTTTVEIPEGGRAPEGFMLTSLMSSPSSAVILDAEGHYVWWYQAVDESYVITRARFGQDGKSIVYLGTYPTEKVFKMEQSVVRVALDGSEVSEFTILGAQRDFYEHADGTMAMLVFDVRVVAGEDVAGEHLLEIHPDGSISEIWNIWDEVDYDPVYGRSFCHANGLDYDPESGQYHLSCHELNAIFRIDRSTGETIWRFGGDSWGIESGDFRDSEGGTRFLNQQHQFQLLDDGIVVFNNQSITQNFSIVLEYGIDWDDFTTELRWDYVSDPPLFCYVSGDVTRMDGGETLVTWSTSGRMEYVSAEAELLWSLQLDFGSGFGYTTVRESLYGGP
jgi:hypothetical protein